jgi:hypothetical protein
MSQMRQAELEAERADSPYFNGRSGLLAKPQFQDLDRPTEEVERCSTVAL